MKASYQPLHRNFGARVDGVALKPPLPEGTLRKALDTHRLLLFRGSELSDDDQVHLMHCFGAPLQENPERESLHSFVSNAREDGILGESAYAFHSDHAFMPDPIDFLSLQAIEAPPGCGSTRFADMVCAAETLPTPLRSQIEGRMGRNVIDPTANPGDVRMREHGHEGLPQALHPLLMPHPRTGQDTLFVTEQQTEQIEGLPRAESDALLEALFAHLYSDAHIYTHEWQAGDLIVWDNRALQHARPNLTHLPRTLRRVSVGGSSVFKLFEHAIGPMHRGAAN